MNRLPLLVALGLLAACGELDPCPRCLQPSASPVIELAPRDLTSATQPRQTAVGARVQLGVYPDKATMLASIAEQLQILDAAGGPVEAEPVLTLAEGSVAASFVELRPKAPLAQTWHRLVLAQVPAGARLASEASARFHPGHRPTLISVALCPKVSSDGHVFHHVDFEFSEPVKASRGQVQDFLQLLPPASGSGSCEWGGAGYLCDGFARTDAFTVRVQPGLVGEEGTPVTTLGGEASFEATLVAPATGCARAEP